MENSFKRVPKTGVIYVMSKAQAHGFYYGNPEWANLGQGAPETGNMPTSPKRLTTILLDQNSSEYSPVSGDVELRKAVAELYNHRYRFDKKSQYTYENVAISSGGRPALCRIAATMNNINLGHFLPDYTAYEELLNVFGGFVSIPISYRIANGFKPDIAEMERLMVNMGLGAMLLSNPCNPTGQIIIGNELKQLIDAAKKIGCAMIFDEFYSHYLYEQSQKTLSAASYVKDVDKDNVLIVDGLTKNWRYPGLRISWTLGPKEVIDAISSAGSFLDGGAVHSIQKAIIPLLQPNHADQEAESIQKEFDKKRKYMIQRLKEMGFVLPGIPEGGFYCFASLENLPETLADGMKFFKALLQYKVICVPGEFFDVNPGQRRKMINTRLKKYVRLSFGPRFDEIKLGLDKIQQMLIDINL
ncbi:pyridoxal phosphate-dependent aminotransferase [Fastidiosibacter lacustris]|uniref:pyridoxal phosphate-dependent aminotransferase n=1 Tax=Fastidiosibacter lacustris TaxID=2056695 RepID=UPI000E3485AF|nr:pyridoxal phosphate-dependent aminotransferase [Fastidiosibacter lacustris]